MGVDVAFDRCRRAAGYGHKVHPNGTALVTLLGSLGYETGCHGCFWQYYLIP